MKSLYSYSGSAQDLELTREVEKELERNERKRRNELEINQIILGIFEGDEEEE